MTTSPKLRALRVALVVCILLSALGAGKWLRALGPGRGVDPALPHAAAQGGDAAAPPAVGAALGTAAAPAGATLTAVDGLPRALEIVLPEEICAEGAAVSLRVVRARRVGAAAALSAARAPLALGPGCAAEVPLDHEALAAGHLRFVEVCAWGGARPRCALLHASRWAPGDPPPEGAVAVGDRWRWAAALEADAARSTGCEVGAPGEIGGQELQQVQLAVGGKYMQFDLSGGGLRAGLGCALARVGHDLETPAVGYGDVELLGLLVQ